MLRLLTFAGPGAVRLGALVDDIVVDLNRADPSLPSSLYDLVLAGDSALELARSATDRVAADLGAQATDLSQAGKVFPLAAVHVLAPFPSPRRNVFCVGRNYLKHAEEGARARGIEFKAPEFPEFFTKPPAAVVGHDAVFPLDEAVTTMLDYEVELAVVIGRRGVNIPPERAYEHIFGYTIGNDMTGRDQQRRHGQWFKGKALDSSCPLGPVVVPQSDIGDPHRLAISLRVNGKTRQNSNTADLHFNIPAIVHYLSLGTALEPGDVILTGTPEGVGMGMVPPGYLKVGDIVEAEVEELGLLRTRVVQA